MTISEDFPCRGCLMLGICRHRGTHTNGVSALAMKCALIDAWMANGKHDWDIERMYDAYDYFKRSWKEDV